MTMMEHLSGRIEKWLLSIDNIINRREHSMKIEDFTKNQNGVISARHVSAMWFNVVEKASRVVQITKCVVCIDL